MADQRFFRRSSAHKIGNLAARIGATLMHPQDADFVVEDVAPLEAAGPEHLSFLDNAKYRDSFSDSRAGAAIVHPDLARLAPTGMKLLLSPTPYKSYAMAAQIFYPAAQSTGVRSPAAHIDSTARLADQVQVDAGAVISAGATIGAGSIIGANAVIGQNVVLGANCVIGAGATISYALIGNDVYIYSGVRIGQDGFGFAIDPKGHVKVPQLGRVIIGNHVEIGANTTIDRGSGPDTVIGDGTWIDNLVQVGHNVQIGRGCVIAAQTGISGSTVIEDFVAMGGQVGVAGHLRIGMAARVAAKSGVTKNIPPKSEYMGYPAIPMKQYLRQMVYLAKAISRPKIEPEE